MAGRTQATWHALLRTSDRVFDAISARPLGIVVFAASLALLLFLETGMRVSIRAEAVADAQSVDHPARIASFVDHVYVRPGDSVEVGAPLVDLSPHFIDRELSRVDAEIEKLLQEAQLAQAELIVREQRWVDPDMRMRPDRPSLEDPTAALYARELAVLQTRRNQLLEDRAGLTISAHTAGRVVSVAPQGASVAVSTSVATLNPDLATEIVAYVPADTPPESIAAGTPVRLVRSGPECSGNAEVLRRGAGVAEAPGQLRNLFRFPVHGLPVYISVPARCALGVGQVLTVEFQRAVM
jgi:multidrug efflux pump subunit AcrA (membrane-fusion protein)